MKIKLHQVGDKTSIFEFRLDRSEMTRIEDRIQFDSMVCTAELTRKQDTIAFHGSYRVKIETNCDSCLEPVEIVVDREFDLILVSEEGYEEPDGDVEISLQSCDMDFFDGQEIVLSAYFEDQLLLDLPFSIKCVESCQGICPECGVNLNQEKCRCTGKSGNSPFSVLGDLKS